MSTEREIFYVADPMCSWCWGFTPVLEAMADQIAGRAEITPIMGGLRPLNRTPMDEAMKAEIAHHWESVAERSGQPFDMEFFTRDGFVYDTEPACRAVCVVRAIDKFHTLDYFSAVQRAFYVEGRDITDGGVLTDVADECGFDPVAFSTRFSDIASAYETAGDFQVARQLNVTGYPTVILRNAKEFAMLSAGYQDFEALQDPLEEWLDGSED